MPNSNITSDKKSIKELIQLIEETSLTEIEYETEAFRVKLVRGCNYGMPNYGNMPMPMPMPQQVFSAPKQANQEEPASENSGVKDYSKHPGVVKSPMVGVVYLSPEPGAPSYVKEGDTVTAEQTLLLVEAMKTFNPVKATKGGKVIKILVADGTPVEYGEPLLVLE